MTIVLQEQEPPKPPPVRRPAIAAYEDAVVQAQLAIRNNGW